MEIILGSSTEDSSIIPFVTINASLEDCSDYILILHSVCAAVLVYCTIPLYIAVFTLFALKRKHLGKDDVFVFAILAGNFSTVLFHSSTIPISTWIMYWPFGEVLCVFTSIVYLIGYDLRYASLVALSIHRFCVFHCPLHYPKRSKCVIAVLSTFIVLYITATRIWYTFYAVVFFDISWPTCDSQAHPYSLSSSVIKLRLVLWCLFHLCGVLPFVLYVIMWCKARRINKVRSLRQGSFGNIRNEKPKILTLTKANSHLKGLKVLLIVLLSGLPTTLIVYLKASTGGTLTRDVDSKELSVVIHFVLTQVTFISPYIDVLFLIWTSREKKEAVLDSVKSAKSFVHDKFTSVTLT